MLAPATAELLVAAETGNVEATRRLLDGDEPPRRKSRPKAERSAAAAE